MILMALAHWMITPADALVSIAGIRVLMQSGDKGGRGRLPVFADQVSETEGWTFGAR